MDADSWEATVVTSEKPAFVMWYSPTCPHCRRFGPNYAACAEAHAGPRYVRIDADDNEALADEHSVSKLPTFQLFRNGELASTFQGRPDESKLLAWARGEVPPFSVRDL